jgi:phage/plasmid-like protein (TIGR03299 family)
MAHNLNFHNGKASYMGRQAAWTKLGTVTGHYMTWEEIQAIGGLNYLPVKRQLSDPLSGDLVDAYGVFRPDTGAFLGAVGDQYTVINHSEGFRMVDALIQSKDGAHYETAGCLGKGEVVWGLADLAMSMNVGLSGDKLNVYLLFATSHNGTISHVYRPTFVRVVCQNTFRAAMATKATSLFKVRHTANAQARLDQAHDALATIGDEVQTIEQKLNMLATRKMTREAMGSILDRLFPQSKDASGKPQDSTRRNNILTDVLRCYETNDNNVFPEQRGTAYNLLNAVTEYTDHVRSTRKDDKGESAMFGSGDRLKTQAMEVIMETAGGLQTVSRPVSYAYAEPTVSLLDQIANAGILGSN